MSDQMTKDLQTLREIRARVDAAIVDLQQVTFNARSEEVQRSVRMAVEHLRFYGDGHGPKGAAVLSRIVEALAPEVYEVLENEGTGEAHKVVDPAMREP